MSTSMTMQTQSQQGKTISRSVTNINPDASDGQLKTLAQSLNNLTTNILGNVNRVDKTKVDMTITYYDLQYTVNYNNNDPVVWTQDASDPTVFRANSVTAAAAQGDPPNVQLEFKIGPSPGSAIQIKDIDWAYDIVASGDSGSLAAYIGDPDYFIVEVKPAAMDATTEGQLQITFPAGKATVSGTVYYFNSLTLTFILAPQS